MLCHPIQYIEVLSKKPTRVHPCISCRVLAKILHRHCHEIDVAIQRKTLSIQTRFHRNTLGEDCIPGRISGTTKGYKTIELSEKWI